MNKFMKGLVKTAGEKGDYVLRDDLPVPEVGDGDVLIKVCCSSICGTDMHIMDWDAWAQIRVKPPIISGHELSGIIVKVGENVTERKVGQRVACESHLVCGECWYCKNGYSNMCKNTSLLGCDHDGAFAQYTSVPANATFLLDDDISYEAGCMFEPMGAGVHGVESGRVEGKTVLVNGCGPIGLTAVSACKVFGAKAVIAADIFDEKLEVANEMGADYTFNVTKCNIAEETKRLTDDIGVDVVLEVSGSEAGIKSGLKCVRAGGRMVSVGLPSKPVTLDLTNDLIYREVEYTGVCGRNIWSTWENFSKVLKSEFFKVDNVVGKKFLIDDFHKAVEEIRNGATGKMLIYPNGIGEEA